MIGITLTTDQIRNAPAEVRQWIEHEVIASSGWRLMRRRLRNIRKRRTWSPAQPRTPPRCWRRSRA